MRCLQHGSHYLNTGQLLLKQWQTRYTVQNDSSSIGVHHDHTTALSTACQIRRPVNASLASVRMELAVSDRQSAYLSYANAIGACPDEHADLTLFAVCSLQFAVCSLQFAVCSLQFAVCSLQFAVCSLQFATNCGAKSQH